ncbi:D-aminoacyl-tRNA deacylase [Lacticaseibacillus zhaodongensis]|uniref:D-aminoacyl-tRNA deacylase n=1 Tax=Lacticaseibacillus zhaodongensis TaxID=2668065 RepID=UPI0012D2B7B7|nr:D-aminoacyl-tRNA deacylase [Lacticaseibacillus zhaodongensis]
MRLVAQRVTSASVRIAGEVVGKIDAGFMVLVGIGPDDDEATVQKLAHKLAKLRVFSDDARKMNLALADVGGSVLSISQFTLYADVRKGNRPSFTDAAKPELGAKLYDQFNADLRALGLHVETGEFGGDMQVELVNDGPVTICFDSAVM